MAERTDMAPICPPFLTIAWMTSRKVSMPTKSPYSMTTKEPMSFSDMTSTASDKG